MERERAMAEEMSREEKIAAAKAKAEAMKAQRAAQAGTPGAPVAPTVPATPGAPVTPGTPAAPATPAGAGGSPAAARPAAPARPAAGTPALATSDNPGGQPVVPPQNAKIQALGTINQSVELRADSTEDQNLRRLLGGIGAYRNPLRGAWQVDYRYYAEAVKRLTAAGYQIQGKDYLGRPLEQWAPARRGWTRIPPK
jgi:hypothetical protein